MSKSYTKTTTTLVIVESPAKCAKIESFLGPGYKCVASFGHLRQLSSLEAIDIKNNFEPKFNIIDDPKKTKHIAFLKNEIMKAEHVILAPDGDREGEAIAWHICDLFGLPVETTTRIIFNEITESAITHAINYPTTINMNLVYSQQARQILDVLVGFTITPLLWKYISKNSKNSLSAGRCQTPALRLVYDNQQDINKSPGKKIYNTTGYFGNKCIPFLLNKHFETEEQVSDFLEKSNDFEHIYSRTEPIKVCKQPPQPLTTSRIQQLASNDMHISPKETMKLCQTLYEAGYITYMRTDSKKYCKEFIDSVKTYIVQTYNKDSYISANIDLLANNSTAATTETAATATTAAIEVVNPKKSKSKTIKTAKTPVKSPPPQEAHEAIRPTYIRMRELPEDVDLSLKERKMYKLIWETSLESCMSPAEFYEITAGVNSICDYKYVYTSEIIDFPGWKIVANKSKEKEKAEENSNKEYHYLLQIKQNSSITFKKITSIVTMSKLKQHYSEAKLVQLLEENGIGRPSTFSTLIDKIQERGYVKKEDVKGVQVSCRDFELHDETITETKTNREFGNEKGKLVIQPLGIIVMEFLCTHFDKLFNYEYTSNMESELDKISKGDVVWHTLCSQCLVEMKLLLEGLTDERKHEIVIDDTHSYIIGKHGPVIKCTESNNGKEEVTFKPVKKDIDLNKLKQGEYAITDVVDLQKKAFIVLGKYREEDLILRKGKFGIYVNWGTNSKSLSSFGNRPLDNITYDEVVVILDSLVGGTGTGTDPDSIPSVKSNIIREITDNISIRNGQYGDYIYYKTTKMKKPTFYKLNGFQEDYKTCHTTIVKNWIMDIYQIRP